ncbi:MAG: hypothetical protein HY282_11695 [Nitrospirae bacterium]|nr:hypothetical protein [Candidatus Manganitrophaceae bacterium]
MNILVQFLARITPPCKEVVQQISESMEHPLSLQQNVRMRLHFLICKWCARYMKQLHFIRSILRRDAERAGQNAPAALSPEAKERIKRSLRPPTE